MKTKPTTLYGQFEAARTLSAQSGFKIFSPSRRYFRAEHQFIAASNDTKAKGVFRLWVRNDSLWIEFLPFYEHRAHKRLLEKVLDIKIRERRYHPAMRRFTPIHNMVVAREHAEFDLLAPNIRLP